MSKSEQPVLDRARENWAKLRQVNLSLTLVYLCEGCSKSIAKELDRAVVPSRLFGRSVMVGAMLECSVSGVQRSIKQCIVCRARESYGFNVN